MDTFIHTSEGELKQAAGWYTPGTKVRLKSVDLPQAAQQGTVTIKAIKRMDASGSYRNRRYGGKPVFGWEDLNGKLRVNYCEQYVMVDG